MAFTRVERHLIGGAAFLVFTRVFAFSLTLLGFTEYARGLAGAGGPSGDAVVGFAYGAYGATMALAQFGSGWLSDRVGRRPVLVIGSLLFVAGAVACVLAADVWSLAGARLVMGLGGVSSVYMAAVGETVPDERRTRAMAMIGVPAGLGVFLGFAVGPALAETFGFPALFWATAAMGILAMLPALRPLPAPLPGLASPKRSLTRGVLGLGLAGFAVNFAMLAVMFDFQSAVLDDLGQWMLGGILVVALLIMGAASRRVDTTGRARAALGLGLMVLSVAAPAFRLLSPLPAVLVAGVGFFAAHASLSAVIPSQVSKLAGRSGGTGHGFQLVIAYLGSAAGGAVAGYFHDRLLFAFAILALAAAGAAAMLWGGLTQGSSEPPAASGP